MREGAAVGGEKEGGACFGGVDGAEGGLEVHVFDYLDGGAAHVDGLAGGAGMGGAFEDGNGGVEGGAGEPVGESGAGDAGAGDEDFEWGGGGGHGGVVEGVVGVGRVCLKEMMVCKWGVGLYALRHYDCGW